MAEEKIPRNLVVEATLELGRNWALAVAIASGGAVMASSQGLIATIAPGMGLGVGVLWTGLAIWRFDEVVSHVVKARRRAWRASAGLLYVLLCVLGGSLVGGAWQLATGAQARGVPALEGAAEASTVIGSRS